MVIYFSWTNALFLFIFQSNERFGLYMMIFFTKTHTASRAVFLWANVQDEEGERTRQDAQETAQRLKKTPLVWRWAQGVSIL